MKAYFRNFMLLLLMWPFVIFADDINVEHGAFKVTQMNSSTSAMTTCEFENGDIVSNCEVSPGSSGEEPNVYVYWTNPVDYTDSSQLLPEHISGHKIYFQKISVNHWTDYRTQQGTTQAVFIYKEPETYSITMTTLTTNAMESDGTDAVVFEVLNEPIDPPTEPPVEPPVEPPTDPQPPELFFDIPEGATVGKITFYAEVPQ